MLTRRFQILAVVGLSAVVATVSGVGCDLNPQPLPPGETSEDGGAAGALGTPDSGSSSFTADAGPGGVSPPLTGGGDGGATGSESDGAAPDAGDAGAADATSDAPSEDAAPDGETDAPVDAGDGGDW
jgi:hypothetical protein